MCIRDRAGSILSKSVEAGVNRIDSVSYFSSNYDASYEEALKGAMEVARTKAQALAEASGKTLGAVARVEEFGYNPSTRYSGYIASGSVKREYEACLLYTSFWQPQQSRYLKCRRRRSRRAAFQKSNGLGLAELWIHMKSDTASRILLRTLRLSLPGFPSPGMRCV